MYKSPVDVFEEINTKITEETDNHIVAEIEKAIGVAVDKDELIKAMNYDRNQYNQGYNDAKELYAPKRWEWIPVSERLPEDMQPVLMTIRRMSRLYNHKPFITVGHISWNQTAWWCAHDGDCTLNEIEVIAWMPLPEPYKAESEGKE